MEQPCRGQPLWEPIRRLYSPPEPAAGSFAGAYTLLASRTYLFRQAIVSAGVCSASLAGAVAVTFVGQHRQTDRAANPRRGIGEFGQQPVAVERPDRASNVWLRACARASGRRHTTPNAGKIQVPHQLDFMGNFRAMPVCFPIDTAQDTAHFRVKATRADVHVLRFNLEQAATL